MAEEIIRVENLGKSFGTHEVLKKIDFTVNKGDITCIIGPSGSGKSTLLRCINVLEKPTNGVIYFHNEPVERKQKSLMKYRSKVGMVFQSFNLFDNLTVLNNCMIGMRKVRLIRHSFPADRSREWRSREVFAWNRKSFYLMSRPARLIRRW